MTNITTSAHCPSMGYQRGNDCCDVRYKYCYTSAQHCVMPKKRMTKSIQWSKYEGLRSSCLSLSIYRMVVAQDPEEKRPVSAPDMSENAENPHSARAVRWNVVHRQSCPPNGKGVLGSEIRLKKGIKVRRSDSRRLQGPSQPAEVGSLGRQLSQQTRHLTAVCNEPLGRARQNYT
ncbi:hypothetical protein BKA93DRAFT_747144 [Sparassis latifolia]